MEHLGTFLRMTDLKRSKHLANNINNETSAEQELQVRGHAWLTATTGVGMRIVKHERLNVDMHDQQPAHCRRWHAYCAAEENVAGQGKEHEAQLCGHASPMRIVK